MNKEQLCKACHISKRTAVFLLENGLIPYIDTGRGLLGTCKMCNQAGNNKTAGFSSLKSLLLRRSSAFSCQTHIPACFCGPFFCTCLFTISVIWSNVNVLPLFALA